MMAGPARRAGWAWGLVVGWLYLSACAGATPPPASDLALSVAWIDEGALWLALPGQAPQPLDAGPALAPLLAPGGERVAYLRTDEGGWRLAVAGPEGALALIGPAELGDGRSVNPANFVWLNDDALLFGTMPRREYGFSYDDDLWRLELNSGQATCLLPAGQGGQIALAPTGQQIALTTPGAYEQQEGAIALAAPDGSNRRVVFTYPAVNSGSEFPFYARPHWSPTGEALYVALPAPDPFTEEATATLWRIPAGAGASAPTQLGTIQADYFGLAFSGRLWSPALEYMAYAQRVGALADNRLAYVLALGDGSEPEQILVAGREEGFEPLGWLEDGYLYYEYGDDGAQWRLRPGGPAERFPAPDQAVFALRWAGGSAYVYATGFGGAFELRLWDGDSARTIANVANPVPDFDARLVE